MPREALLFYYQSLQVKSDEKKTHFFIGITYRTLGNFYQAVLAYQKALQIDPDFAEGYFNLGNLYYDEAIEHS